MPEIILLPSISMSILLLMLQHGKATHPTAIPACLIMMPFKPSKYKMFPVQAPSTMLRKKEKDYLKEMVRMPQAPLPT